MFSPEVKLSTEGENLEKQKVQQKIISELHHAANSQARVECFARLTDKFGLDPILSLIPALGDAGASSLSGLYLLCEAQNAGLSKKSYLKIIGLQAADFSIGTIPVLGDIADYFFKANNWSAREFEKRTRELVEKAREAGVAEEDIAKITEPAEKLPQLVKNALRVVPKPSKKPEASFPEAKAA